jgi:hypothetical protein
LAALITFAHFSVAPAMNLSKSAGKPGSTVAPQLRKPGLHSRVGESSVDAAPAATDRLQFLDCRLRHEA